MTFPLVTRVLVADDHPIVRRGLRELLDPEPDFKVVAETADGADAVRRALAEDVDLAILDVAMPRLTGLQAARELAARRPGLRLLILSMHENEQFFFEALSAGASGYVMKTTADRDLVEACRSAVRGEAFLHAGAVSSLVRDHLQRIERGGGDPDPLTPRELEGGRQARRRGPHQRRDRGAALDQPLRAVQLTFPLSQVEVGAPAASESVTRTDTVPVADPRPMRPVSA
jgi:DNA-binding NarL/FixJ family response regulator